MKPTPESGIGNLESAVLPLPFAPQYNRRAHAYAKLSCKSIFGSVAHVLKDRPELLFFLALLAAFNVPILKASCLHSFIFLPRAVQSGEWWRLLLHPFVHVTWYHLSLDGTAFLALYCSLIEASLLRRLLYVLGGAMGSVLASWAAAPAISSTGLCGLSGVAHGLMAVSALELIACKAPGSTERRIGQISFILVVGKAALEALSGRMFFTFLHFGLMGEPVAVSHAGGIIGSLLAMLVLRYWGESPPRSVAAGSSRRCIQQRTS